MELRHLTLEIFLTFSECFGEFSDLFLYKNVSNKKKMYDFFLCIISSYCFYYFRGKYKILEIKAWKSLKET